MPALRELAHVSTRRRFDVGSIEERSWLMWTRFREATADDPTRTKVEGGVLVIGSMKAHARLLFPTEVAWGDPEAEASFMTMAYQYLRRSGNAYVMRRNLGGPYINEWFLSDEWVSNRDGGGQRPSPRKRKLDATIAKLTASEAGEDRAPGAVTTTWRCTVPGCGSEFPTQRQLSGHGVAHAPNAKRTKAYIAADGTRKRAKRGGTALPVAKPRAVAPTPATPPLAESVAHLSLLTSMAAKADKYDALVEAFRTKPIGEVIALLSEA